MVQTLIKNAKIVNEGKIFTSDILLKNERIEKISTSIEAKGNFYTIDASGLYLLPGMIDAHVHFREPGLTQKGNIASESSSAVAGGVTSYFEMPNTFPNATDIELLEDKFSLASQSSLANYSFYFGVNENNIEKALKVNTENVCGITDDGLFFPDTRGGLCNRPEYLEELFKRSESLIALHCEDEETIRKNIEIYNALYPTGIPHEFHSLIRFEEACIIATKRVIDIAWKTKARVHILHVSTAKEAEFIGEAGTLSDKQITGEACIHHLYFSDKDYKQFGSDIIWNPSIKSKQNREELIRAVKQDWLQIIATDHAPHLRKEKLGNYHSIKPGAPSVQHALQALLHLYGNSEESLPFIVNKTSHAVAETFKIIERGYIREGYFADLVLINLDSAEKPRELLYKCAWSPFAAINFGNKIEKTFVNAHLVYADGKVNSSHKGMRLMFNKNRK